MHIHVSNLNSNFIEADLQRLFSPFGEIESVELVRDKLNNRSLCRGYIAMPVNKQAEQAIASLHGTEVKGKRLQVTQVVYDPSPHSSWSHSSNA